MNAGWIAVVFWVCSRIHLWTRLALRLYPKAMFACRHGAEGAWKIRLMGQKWCPLKLGGHHGLRRRCREGVLAGRILLNYVVWGNGSVSARLWNAIRSDDWAIPHVGLSSLGEIVGWARPDEFPPRNMQTSKGLRALGYNVRIGV